METILFENKEVIFKNFSGAPSKFDSGKRTFNIVLEPQDIETLDKIGSFNIKTRESIDGTEPPINHIKVNINPESRVNIFLVNDATKEMTSLDIDSYGILDTSDIISVDAIVRPWEYDKEAHKFVLYLQNLYVKLGALEKYSGYTIQ